MFTDVFKLELVKDQIKLLRNQIQYFQLIKHLHGIDQRLSQNTKKNFEIC